MLVFKNTNNLLNNLNLIFSKSQNVRMHFSHCIYLMSWCLNSLGAFKRTDFCLFYFVFYTINCAQNNNINKQCTKCILCIKLKKKNPLITLFIASDSRSEPCSVIYLLAHPRPWDWRCLVLIQQPYFFLDVNQRPPYLPDEVRWSTIWPESYVPPEGHILRVVLCAGRVRGW